MRIYVFLLIVAVWASDALPAERSSARAGGDGKEIVRGIIISTHGSGRDWGTDVMAPTLRDIREVGANWVAIHPYARVRADGSVTFRAFDPAHPPAYLTRPIEEAHALGLNICIKPHLAYWGSPFRWRGEITFDDEAQWARFWRDYRAWILDLATACKQADGFIVGTELDGTLHDEDAWRSLIRDVRAVVAMPLTYAANWTAYRDVGFWDALDVIGIQAYFPLTTDPHPAVEDIQAGWARRMAELRAYAQAMNRKVLFTELGYNQSYIAPVAPWDYHVDGEDAQPVQEACLQAALAAVRDEPSVVGALLWKWFPYPRPVGRNFQMAAPHMRKVISSIWLDRDRPAVPVQATE